MENSLKIIEERYKKPSARRLSPDSVISFFDLTDEGAAVSEHHSNNNNKRLSAETVVKQEGDQNKKIKLEPTSSRASSSSTGQENEDAAVDDDDVQLLDTPNGEGTNSLSIPVEETTDSANNGEVAVVGTKNHVPLPHMRQHCTIHPFQTERPAGCTLGEWVLKNSEHCDLCFCFVCDVPVKDCVQWDVKHCMATDQGPRQHYWNEKRRRAKEHKETNAKPFANEDFHLRHECPIFKFNPQQLSDFCHRSLWYPFAHGQARRCSKCLCYVCNLPAAQCHSWFTMDSNDRQNRFNHCLAHPDSDKWDEMRREALIEKLFAQYGSGPFEPDHEIANQEPAFLTKCRHCGWYSDMRRRVYSDENEISGIWDWCHACGRVAREQDFCKHHRLHEPYQPAKTDVFLGTRSIPFRLHAHDPRCMNRFASRWKELEGQPCWIFDASESEVEFFLHMIGKHPGVDILLDKTPIVKESDIPTDGLFGCETDRDFPELPSAEETQAIIIEDPSTNLPLLREVRRNNPHFGTYSTQNIHQWLCGDIEANWDPEKRNGVRTIETDATS
jgi:hypothetical protein